MSNSRIHIDHLFARGLENLEIPIVHHSFEQIRKDIPETISDPASFSNFEIAVTDADWQAIKAKLAQIQAAETVTSIEKPLKELELAVSDTDWNIIKDRLAMKDNAAIVPVPVDTLGASLKDFEIAVTDADWKVTENKLDQYRKKKMIWWWWLNIAIIGSLIGLALNYYAPLGKASVNNQTVIAGTVKIAEPVPTIEKPPTGTNPSASSSNTFSKNTHNAEVSRQEAPSHGNSTGPGHSVSRADDANKFKSAEHPAGNPIAKVDAGETNNNAGIDIQKQNGLVSETAEQEKTKDVKEVTQDPVQPNIRDVIRNTNEEPAPAKPVEQLTQTVRGNDVSASPVNATDTPKKTTPVNPPGPPGGGGGLHFYAGLVSDVAMTYRKLDKSNNDYYNKIRNNAERPIAQFSYGFTAGIIKGKDQLQTGVQYTTQNFVSNYNYTYPIYDSIPLYGPPPTYVFKGYFLFRKRDTIMHTEQKVTIKKIEIPFNYSRIWDINSKTQLITGVSAIMSFNTKATGGLTLNPANNQLYYYHLQKKYEQQTAFSPGINLGLQRQIAPNLMIQGNAYGRYTLTNRYMSSYGVKENLYSYGLSIKLLYLIK